MTVARGLWVLLMMLAVSLAVVAIRGESAKVANRVQILHQQQIGLEQLLWTREMELAKLRGPEEIRRRASELGLDVVPPVAAPAAGGATTGD